MSDCLLVGRLVGWLVGRSVGQSACHIRAGTNAPIVAFIDTSFFNSNVSRCFLQPVRLSLELS